MYVVIFHWDINVKKSLWASNLQKWLCSLKLNPKYAKKMINKDIWDNLKERDVKYCCMERLSIVFRNFFHFIFLLYFSPKRIFLIFFLIFTSFIINLRFCNVLFISLMELSYEVNRTRSHLKKNCKPESVVGHRMEHVPFKELHPRT